jgi:hypothetical protein
LEVLVSASRLALSLATIAFGPALAACAGAGPGGHAAGGHHAHAHGAGPYAGLQTREIKALSP